MVNVLDEVTNLEFEYLFDEEFDAKMFVDSLTARLVPKWSRGAELDLGYSFNLEGFRNKYIERFNKIV